MVVVCRKGLSLVFGRWFGEFWVRTAIFACFDLEMAVWDPDLVWLGVLRFRRFRKFRNGISGIVEVVAWSLGRSFGFCAD